eukprot:jgi/Psemu1/188782/e_gw1.81.134.1
MGVECQLSPADIAAAGSSLVSGRNPVIGIYLTDNFLSGRTPASLWKLPALKWLDLGFNPALDVDFGSLADSSADKVPPIEGISVRQTATTSVKGVHALSETLTELTLSENKFESQFPPDLLELRKLTSLSCADCFLRGGLPDDDGKGIDQLSQLRYLDLYNNDLTGTLPEALSGLVHLRSLILAKNQFHGKLPQFVNDDLVLLEQFWINFNDFTGTIPAFDKQPAIQKLYLNGNSFTGSIPDTFLDAAVAGPEGFAASGSTLMINLGKNEFTGTIPASLDRLSILPITWRVNVGGTQTKDFDGIQHANDFFKQLYADNTPISGTIPSEITRIHNLEVLSLQGCDLNGELPVGIFAMSSLERLYLAQNNFQGFVPDRWSALKNLEVLSLAQNAFRGNIPHSLGNAPSLRALTLKDQLDHNGLKGTVPSLVWTLPNLVHLKIYGNDVNVEFGGIEFAKKLKTLRLGDTGMRSLEGLGRARSLTSLNLAKNNLAGNLPQELSRLVNLESLDLSSNKFTGELPFWLKNLAALKSFSVYDNKIGGPLPDFASLTKITYLDLSHNQFKGTIPPTLLAGSPPDDKVVVDLSYNKVNGVVPGEISRLSRLSIHLEENEIIGIDAQICATNGVNDFDAMSYGCSGILCPIGTWNSLGRQSNDVPCEPCKKAKYMGSTTCGSDTTTVGSGAVSAPTGNALLAALAAGIVVSWGVL